MKCMPSGYAQIIPTQRIKNTHSTKEQTVKTTMTIIIKRDEGEPQGKEIN